MEQQGDHEDGPQERHSTVGETLKKPLLWEPPMAEALSKCSWAISETCVN